MATQAEMEDAAASQRRAGVHRRAVLRFGTLVAALTGASAASVIGSESAQAATDGYLSTADAEANYAQLSTLAATFRPATTRQQSPAETIVTAFQSGHNWTTTGAGASWDLNWTGDAYAGAQCVRGTTMGTGGEGAVQRYGFTPSINFTNKVMVLPVKIVSGLAHLSEIRVLLSNNGFNANTAIRLVDGNSGTQVIREGEWFNFRFTLADITSTSGAPDLSLTNSIRLIVKDKGTGVTVIQFGKFSYYTPPTAAQYPNGAVTLWFDDSYASHRTIAAPYMARYGFVGSAAIICDKIDRSGMTVAQLKQLADVYDWEINPHSYTVASHAAGFDSMTEQQLVDEINSMKSWMARHGFGANDHFAYPLGRHSPVSDAVVGRYFSTARTTKAQPLETMLTGNRLRTRCIGTTNTSTLPGLASHVDRAHRAGVWLQIYFHDIVESGATKSVQMNRTVFEGFIDYLAAKGSRVMTAGDVWNAGI